MFQISVSKIYNFHLNCVSKPFDLSLKKDARSNLIFEDFEAQSDDNVSSLLEIDVDCDKKNQL